MCRARSAQTRHLRRDATLIAALVRGAVRPAVGIDIATPLAVRIQDIHLPLPIRLRLAALSTVVVLVGGLGCTLDVEDDIESSLSPAAEAVADDDPRRDSTRSSCASTVDACGASCAALCPVGRSCDDDADCETGLCLVGRCSECITEVHCGVGQCCRKGECVSPEVESLACEVKPR